MLILAAVTGSAIIVTYPSEWTRFADATLSPIRTRLAYRTADGTEGTTISLTLNGSGGITAMVHRITGWCAVQRRLRPPRLRVILPPPILRP